MLFPALLVPGFEEAHEAFQRELGVDRDQALAQVDDGVDLVAIAEGVLQGKVAGRQDLAQQVLQQVFAQVAAQLGRAQDVLQRRDVLADGLHLVGRFLEQPQLLLDLAHYAQLAGDVPLPLAQGLVDRAHDVVQLPALLDQGLVLRLQLGGFQLLHLVLQVQHLLVQGGVARPQLQDQHGQQQDQGYRQQHDEQDRFHSALLAFQQTKIK